jgi:hypothetical protein
MSTIVEILREAEVRLPRALVEALRREALRREALRRERSASGRTGVHQTVAADRERRD